MYAGMSLYLLYLIFIHLNNKLKSAVSQNLKTDDLENVFLYILATSNGRLNKLLKFQRNCSNVLRTIARLIIIRSITFNAVCTPSRVKRLEYVDLALKSDSNLSTSMLLMGPLGLQLLKSIL